MSARRRLAALAVAFGLALTAPAGAVQPDEILKDPALEKRAREISVDLRCMVCQNQSIDDSDAPLARDLRILVRERLQAGDSNAAVKDYLVERYGQFVLLRPRFDWGTAVLWLAPFAVLGLGIAGIVMATRSRRVVAGPERLSPEEQKRLDEMLGRSNP